jgi:hypothetical protein
MVKSRLALFFLLAPHFLHGMKNNERALTTSSARSLMRNVLSYGPALRNLKNIVEKPLTYALLPLAVGCASLQNASMPDAHYFPTDQEPYGGTISAVVIGSMGAVAGIGLLGGCVFLFKVFHYNNGIDDDAPYPTIAPIPLFYDSHPIDMKKIMRSRTSNPDADNALAFGQRYGSGNLHHFFGGCYGDYQREVADTIVLCLQQQRVNMPGGLQVQIPRELAEEIGKQVQHIDWAVLRKLVKSGGHPIYHDPSRDVYRLMTPTLFPWDKKTVALKWHEQAPLSLRNSEKKEHEVIEII